MFVGQPSTDLLEDLGSSEGKVMATSVGLIPDNPCAFPGISWGYFVAAFYGVLAKKEPCLAPVLPFCAWLWSVMLGQKINLLSLSKTELGNSICHRQDSVRHPCPLDKQDGVPFRPPGLGQRTSTPLRLGAHICLTLARCPSTGVLSEPNYERYLLSTYCCARPDSGC